jgi:hypothetical protein
MACGKFCLNHQLPPESAIELTWPAAQALRSVASKLRKLGRTPLDRSPSLADHRPPIRFDQSRPRTFVVIVPSSAQTR